VELRLGLVGRRSYEGLIPREYLMVVEGDQGISGLPLSVEAGIIVSGDLRVNRLKGALRVQLVKLHELRVEADVRIILLRKDRCRLELFLQLRRTTLLQGLHQPLELTHVLLQHDKSSLGKLQIVEDILRVLGVLMGKVASDKPRHNFHAVDVD
jgi:hypothetical protein